jgi:hypothetical protein
VRFFNNDHIARLKKNLFVLQFGVPENMRICGCMRNTHISVHEKLTMVLVFHQTTRRLQESSDVRKLSCSSIPMPSFSLPVLTFDALQVFNPPIIALIIRKINHYCSDHTQHIFYAQHSQQIL